MALSQFNEAQSRQLAAHFITRLANEVAFEGHQNLLKTAECFLHDPLYPEVWKETYEDTFGKIFSPNTLLTKEEVFTTLIELCLRFIFEWNIDLSETVRLFFLMKFQPQKYPQEVAIWEQVSQQPLEEKSVLKNSVAVFKRRPPISPRKPALYGWDGFELMKRYLERLWEQHRYLFSEDGVADFGGLLTDFGLDAAAPDDWKDAYERAFGRVLLEEALLTEEEVFTAMTDYVAQYLYGWGHNVSEVFNLLLLIRHHRKSYEYGRQIWQEEVKKLLVELNGQG